jgi:phytoene dehydrogenase-like protein
MSEKPSPQKRVVIIGAGIAGLSAGCYAQMNGYASEIFEMHNLPGGVCTSWKRKGYTFDGAIHWLSGTLPGTSMYTVLSELGATRDKHFIHHDVFRQIVIDGQRFNVYTNADELEREMLRVAPEDERAIRAFIADVRRFGGFDLPLDRSHPTPHEFLHMLPYLPDVLRLQGTTIAGFAASFQNPFLRQALMNIFPMPNATLLIAVLTLALFHRGDNGYPEGGSLALSKDIEKRYLELGGIVHYQARVTKILTEGGQAVGVRLEDGSEHRADTVISAADGHSTLFELLGEDFLDSKTSARYRSLALFKPLVYVCLGIDADLSNEPHIVTNVLADPVELAGEKLERLGWFHYCYDPTSAPQGKSAVISMIETNYDFWEKARQDPERYEAEKQKAAALVIAKLAGRYPGISEKVEVVDVATPMTWVRYTGNWRGAYEGWLPTREALNAGFQKTLPGLSSFYMCGQWVEPGGGVPVSMISGRNVIRMLCKRDHIPFSSGASQATRLNLPDDSQRKQ